MVRSLVSSFMLLACFLVSAITGRAAPLAASLTALNLWNLLCLVLLLWPLVQSLVVYHMATKAAAGGGGSGESGGVGSPKENGHGETDLEVSITGRSEGGLESPGETRSLVFLIRLFTVILLVSDIFIH